MALVVVGCGVEFSSHDDKRCGGGEDSSGGVDDDDSGVGGENSGGNGNSDVGTGRDGGRGMIDEGDKLAR